MKRQVSRIVAGIIAFGAIAWIGALLRLPRGARADEPRYFAIRGAKIFHVSGPPNREGHSGHR